jgi:hypothetical protein
VESSLLFPLTARNSASRDLPGGLKPLAKVSVLFDLLVGKTVFGICAYLNLAKQGYFNSARTSPGRNTFFLPGDP